jgi:Winged helix-turn helix
VTVRLMSDGELSRLEELRDLDRKRLTTKAAAQLLGLERRQVFRLLKVYRTEGATGLISRRRGRRSNRRKPEALRRAVLAMILSCPWGVFSRYGTRASSRCVSIKQRARLLRCLKVGHVLPERRERPTICGYSIVSEMACDDLLQPVALIWDSLVHSQPQLRRRIYRR